jgi:hypothetical protein
MPKRVRQPAPSTVRVRRTRTRRRIAKFQKDDTNWLLFIIQQFYIGHDIPLNSWTLADEIFDAPVTDKDIQASVLLPDKNTFIQNLQNSPAIETARLTVLGHDVLIVRPRWLRNEVLSI